MSERLVNLHLIEPGSRGGDALFEVSLLLSDSDRDALREGDREYWRRTIGRARKLIGDHVSSKRESAADEAF
jgi:hypothetical protein